MISWACGVVRGSSQWMASATDKHPISTIKNAPVGALVWMKGHIGIYTGMKTGVPYYIAADGSAYGVREVPLSKNRFTHWLLDKNVFDYTESVVKVEGDDEMVEKDIVIADGKKYTVDMIRKNGITYIKARDVAEILRVNISSQGRTPVFQTK